MEQRMDLVTLGVADVAAARRFYVDGLGWTVAFEVPGDIVFIQANHGLLLALFSADNLAADAGAGGAGAGVAGAGGGVAEAGGAGAPPMSLAQVVASEDDVRSVWKQALAAGATAFKEPQHADFGGFHCYFADPSGFRWEVATNAGWHVGPDGTVTIGPID